MRKCIMNWISFGCISLGSFLLGAATGLALGKDEEDIWAEDAIRLDDVNYGVLGYIKKDGISEADLDGDELVATTSKESYDRMVRDLYGDLSPEAQAILENKVDHDELFDEDEDLEEDEIFDATIKEIETDAGIVQVKETSEGLMEVKEPYVISEDKYFDETILPEFFKESLIYYEEDDVLTTERDEVIYDVDETIGTEALNSFGVKSTDKNTVFVRNVRLGIDYEITRDRGSYKATVLGLANDEDDNYRKAKQFFNKLDEEREE